MIKSLHIESFKSIELAELELGQVNVIIGANGSGKSNLLEGIALLAAAAGGKVDQSLLMWRGCRSGSYYRPLFQDSALDANARLSAEGANASYRVELSSPKEGKLGAWHYQKEMLREGKKSIVDRRTANGSASRDPESGLAALRLAEIAPSAPVSIFLKSLAAFSIYQPDTPFLRGAVEDRSIREPLGLSGGRLAEAVDELTEKKETGSQLMAEFKRALSWFGGFGVMKLKGEKAPEPAPPPMLAFMDKYFRNDTGHFRLLGPGDINEGALYLAFIMVLCLHPKAPAFFAVENWDHGMNPRLVKVLMQNICTHLLATQDRQVLLTTHNPMALDGLPLNDERVRLFTVDRTFAGKTVVSRVVIDEKLRALAARDGATLSRLWIMGHLGGVPNV